MKHLSLLYKIKMRHLEVAIYIFMSMTALDGVVGPYFMARILEALAERSVGRLLGFVGAAFLTYAVVRTSLYLWEVSQEKFTQSFNLFIKVKMLKSYFIDSPFQEDDSVYSIITSDAKLLETHYVGSYFHLVYCIAFSLVASIYILTIHVPLALMFVLFSILSTTASSVFKQKTAISTTEWTQDSEAFMLGLKEHMAGKQTIDLFNAQYSFLQKVTQLLEKMEISRYRMNKMIYQAKWLSNILGGISTYVPLLIGGIFVINGEVSVANFIALYLASDRVISPLVNAVYHYNRIQSTKPIISRIVECTDTKSPNTPKLRESLLPIECSQLAIGYQFPIVSGIQLKIHQGDKILLCGKSGSGKTTLLRTLLQLLPALQGNISYNGTSRTAGELVSNIGYFQQEVFVFNESLRLNVTLGEAYSDTEVIGVLSEVKLDDVLYEKGLDTVIGYGGSELSGGQRARVALARILLRSYDVVFLDELSSSLDVETCHFIRCKLHEYYDTLIEISHDATIDKSLYNKEVQL